MSRLIRTATLLAGCLLFVGHAARAEFTTGAFVGTTGESASDASSEVTSSPSQSSSGDDDTDKTARKFIHQNYDPLQTDIARGRGEHLQAVMSLYHCAPGSQPALIGAIREDVRAQMTSEAQEAQDLDARASALHQLIRHQVHGAFAAACVA